MVCVAEVDLTTEDARVLTWAATVLFVTGVLSVVAGIIVLLRPHHSLNTLAVIIGVFMVAEGVLQLVYAAFGGSSPAAVVLAAIGAIAGVLLIRHPDFGVGTVALLVGLWLIAVGLVRFAYAASLRLGPWPLIVAILEVIAGVIIVASPHIGFVTLAVIVGISFIVNGAGMIAVGTLLRSAGREIATPDRP